MEYKCTRQLISEKSGKGSTTVDEELESQVAVLKETQKKYLSILRLAKQGTKKRLHTSLILSAVFIPLSSELNQETCAYYTMDVFSFLCLANEDKLLLVYFVDIF
jgi:hypothetical protein